MTPKSFDKSIRSKIRTCLWGYSENVPTVILTPFKRIFHQIGKNNKEFKGWWKSYLLNKDYLIVLTPQGSQVIDAISCLEENTNLVFIGLAGSFGKLKVGDIVEPAISFYNSSESRRTAKQKPSFKTASIATVGSLAESFEKSKLLQKNAECVDMETGIIFETSIYQDKTARSIQIISDDVSKNFFFNTDLKNIEPQIEIVSNFIRKGANNKTL